MDSSNPGHKRTSWTIMDEGDLELLGRLKEVLDEQRRKEEEHLEFLKGVWTEALDQAYYINGEELFWRPGLKPFEKK